jgi:hypothetical protein
MGRFSNRNQDDQIAEPTEREDAPLETPPAEQVAAEANVANVITTGDAAPADPWAFLAGENLGNPVEHVKQQPVETDVPLALRTLCEKALTLGVPLAVTFPNADLVKPALKFFKMYAMYRNAGKLVIRAGVQNDGVTIHLTSKLPKVHEIAEVVETVAEDVATIAADVAADTE